MLPILAGILTQLAGNGLSLLSQAIQTKGKEVIEEKLGINIEDAVQSPEGLLKLKELELQHEEMLLEYAQKGAETRLQELQEDNKNTDSARDMNTKIQSSTQASTLAKNAAYILDYIIVGTTFFMIGLMFFQAVPKDNKEFFYMALGSLLTMCGTVINFHRGTSQGSKDMSNFVRKMADLK